jgi:predicted amidophosphoribosyltransferase
MLCAPCVADLPWLPRSRCAVCAVPLASGAVCGACLDHPPRFDRVEAPFAYRFPVDALIHALKYGGRLAERGFNQALEIARVVAGRTGIPLLPLACRKVVDTPPQATLPWKERAKNVRRAFVCDAGLRDKRIAVVDDVLTTGATLNELARVLRRAGAIRVDGWVVARTLPHWR